MAAIMPITGGQSVVALLHDTDATPAARFLSWRHLRRNWPSRNKSKAEAGIDFDFVRPDR